MLERLIIRNFVLIDELDIDFRSGFTAITGETGAGKSILLGAIGLLMGQRADSSSVLPGADRCIIEAHFSGADTMIDEILETEDIEHDETLIIRREISTKGKSRSFVNDTPASLALLKRLSEYLIDIHSQHKNLLLGDAHFQLSVLDLYADTKALQATYTTAYQQYRTATAELEALRLRHQEALRDQDYLQYQYDQLEQAGIKEGELTALEDEEHQLTHAQEIMQGLGRSYNALDDDERGVMQALSVAVDGLNSIRRYYAPAEELLERMQSTRIELDDLRQTIDTARDAIEYNPDRLTEITERIDLINGLMQRHSVSDADALITITEEIGLRLEQMLSFDMEIERLEAEVETLRAQAQTEADRLHEVRTSAARSVETALIYGLSELGMPHVKLVIDVDQSERFTPTGQDVVTIRFSANKDIKPEPVADIASGGEISRLMLCIKALIADRRHLPTIIFDEIDTGVSGDIADKIGTILQRMGQSMQVMAVTHLPQIAASGRWHYYIYKEHGDASTRSHIRLLDADGRTDEIARMQSGSKLTDISRAAAKALLETAQERLS